MRRHRIWLVLAIAAVAAPFVLTALPTSAQAQQGGASNVITQLPPALRAAVLSGNAAAVTQAINVLSGGNPTQAATLSAQVVSAAEQMLATNPQAAVEIAGAAVNVVNQLPVQTSSPTQVMTVVTTAARIIINPAAQRVAPQSVAQIAATAVRVVSNPAVYQASPSAAIQVMSNSYNAVINPTVAAAAPGATANITQLLNQASLSNNLNAANPSNATDIAAILARNSNTNLPGNENQQAEQPQQPVVEENNFQNQSSPS